MPDTDKMENREDILRAAVKRIEEDYSLCAYYIFRDGKRIILGNKDDRVCRFCGRRKGDGVKFRHEAHALSNLIGNNRLFTYYECDECNQKFSKYENDFAEYFRLYHCILRVQGKRGVPTYKRYQSRIDVDKSLVQINKMIDDPTLKCEVDEENKKVLITGYRTYLPVYVYKALLKMALTIMPEEELENFENTMAFLNAENVEVKSQLPVIIQLYGKGYNVHNGIAAIILKRKASSQNRVFSYSFILAYNNFCLQMPLLGSKLDQFEGDEPVLFKALPTPPAFDGYPIILNSCFDLRSSEKVKDEPVTITLSFSDVEKTEYITEN